MECWALSFVGRCNAFKIEELPTCPQRCVKRANVMLSDFELFQARRG